MAQHHTRTGKEWNADFQIGISKLAQATPIWKSVLRGLARDSN